MVYIYILLKGTYYIYIYILFEWDILYTYIYSIYCYIYIYIYAIEANRWDIDYELVRIEMETSPCKRNDHLRYAGLKQ